MENRSFDRKVFGVLCCIAGIIALAYGKQLMQCVAEVLGLFQAFAVGIAIAFVFHKPYDFIRQKLKQQNIKDSAAGIAAICVVYLAIAAFIAGIIGILIPQLSLSIKMIIANAGDYLTNLQQEMDVLANILRLPAVDVSALIGEALQKIVDLTSMTGKLVSTVVSATGTAVSSTASAVIAVIFSIYMLTGKDKLIGQTDRLCRAYLPQKTYHYLVYVKEVVVQSFENYIVGQGIEAVILGCLCFIGMVILRLDYASLVSVIVAITALIPIMGAYIGGAVAVILQLMVSPGRAIIFLIFFFILQQVENKLIYPRVVGGRIGLSGMWVLLAITVGTKLAGIVGTIFGVPLMSIVYTLVKDGVHKREVQTVKESEQSKLSA